jgi:hypothetical protein
MLCKNRITLIGLLAKMPRPVLHRTAIVTLAFHSQRPAAGKRAAAQSTRHRPSGTESSAGTNLPIGLAICRRARMLRSKVNSGIENTLQANLITRCGWRKSMRYQFCRWTALRDSPVQLPLTQIQAKKWSSNYIAGHLFTG